MGFFEMAFCMKNVTASIAMLGMSVIFWSGCGRSPDPRITLLKAYKQTNDTDVTASPQYNFTSFTNTGWKTKVKMAVLDVKRYNNEHAMDLVPPGCFDPADPNYIPILDSRIIVVLPVGTHLRIDRLMEDNGVWGGVRVMATLEGATNSQRTVYVNPGLLAKNRFIWAGWSLSTNWDVNADMLEKDP
jgi:hypothetical protein